MKKLNFLITSSVKELNSITTVAVSGLLTALNVILRSFTIVVSNLLQFSFSFLAVAAAGMLYGPIVGGIVGAIGDVIGYFLVPAGPFFFGFTFNAFLSGFVYGMFLYKKKVTLLRVFLANITLVLLVNFLLNPLWLSIMYGRAFVIVLSMRIISSFVMLPIHVAMLYLVLKFVQKIGVFAYKKV